jgi:predicted transcriptional regulator
MIIKNNIDNLYVIKTYSKHETIVKLGYSSNIVTRLKSYDVLPDVELINTFYREDAYYFEKTFHKHNTSLFQQEWYSITMLDYILKAIENKTYITDVTNANSNMPSNIVNPFIIGKAIMTISYNYKKVNINYFITFYNNEGFMKSFLGLTYAGRDVLFLVSKYINKDEDYIYISVSKFAKRLNKSIQHVYKGLSNLIDNNFITKYKGSLYWINPHFMFKGNKAKKYNTKEVGLDIVKTL